MHRAGVVHKDLKPDNIMMLQEAGIWEPKLIDFGISGSVADDGVTYETVALHTVRYTAPEKRLKNARRSRAADVYSLGVVFVDLLIDSVSELEPEVQVAESGELLSEPMRALLRDMLAEEPEARPTTEVVWARLDGTLDPVAWDEASSRAAELFVDDEFEAALRLFGRAIAEAPAGVKHGAEYGELLRDTLDCMELTPESMDWWETVVSACFDYAIAVADPFDWGCLGRALEAQRRASTGAAEPFRFVLSALSQTNPASALAPLVGSLCESDVILTTYADDFHPLLVDYCRHALVDASVAANFCVSRARHSRMAGARVTDAELWLLRARRLHPPGTDDYATERGHLDGLRQQTGTIQTLPTSGGAYDEKVVGERERGHLYVDRINAFAGRIRDAYPFVHAVKRVKKDPGLSAPAPRVLGLDNVSQHLVDGVEAERIIPFVIDSSYSRASGGRSPVPVRMNIVLPVGTTQSQRQAAFDLMVDDRALFPG